MIYIIVKLLHNNPKDRFKSLDVVREALLTLKQNIQQTPSMLRQQIKHPLLPGEDFSSEHTPVELNLKGASLSAFSLKYLAKFIIGCKVQKFAITGGFMQLKEIKEDRLTLLDLHNQELRAEDLFILS